MEKQYWLVHPDGARQRIDPELFDLVALSEQMRLGGADLYEVTEVPAQVTGRGPSGKGRDPGGGADATMTRPGVARVAAPTVTHQAVPYQPPLAALGPLFRARLRKIYLCEKPFKLDINARPTSRVLGGYYKDRRLIRIYTHDTKHGRRPLEELFDTFLHEVAHHLEYTEPRSFGAERCARVPGRMHSELFWRILGELKGRWVELQAIEARRHGR